MAEGIVHDKKNLEGVLGKEVKCEGCTDSGDTTEAFCHQCAEFICKECVESHKIMKLFASHEVVSLEDLKQHRAGEIAVREPPTKKKCHVHKEPLNVYCFDCDKPICHHCTTTVHRDHNLKSATPDSKKNLLEKLGSLKQVAANLSSAIENIQTTKQEVEAEEEDRVASAIHASFNELHQVLDERENLLFLEALRKMQDNEAMSMHYEIWSSPEALRQLCQTNTHITQPAVDPAQCTVRGEGVETAEVHQTAEVTLTTNLFNSKTVMVGQLKSLYDGSVVVMNPQRFSNVPSVVRGGLLPPEPKLYPSPIVSQILLNYIMIQDTTQGLSTLVQQCAFNSRSMRVVASTLNAHYSNAYLMRVIRNR